MKPVEPSDGYRCSWCGEPVESVSMPDHPTEKIVGKCDDDGLVYVTEGPDVNVGGRL